jgi:hypothetical protein
MADIASSSAAHTNAPSRSTAGALASLSFAMLLSSLGTSIANVALPTLAAAFAASFPAVQWVPAAPWACSAPCRPSAPRLGRRSAAC